MPDLELRSDDRRFGVTLKPAQLEELLCLCKLSWPLETGGILIGQYTLSRDMALITYVVPPPPDSRSNSTSFFRGWQGLQRILSKFWCRPDSDRWYYLGEWHFHPDAAPLPSQKDRSQMQEIAQSRNYHCPEPILLIVGGGPGREEWSLSANVFRRTGTELPLLEEGGSSVVVEVPRAE